LQPSKYLVQRDFYEPSIGRGVPENLGSGCKPLAIVALRDLAPSQHIFPEEGTFQQTIRLLATEIVDLRFPMCIHFFPKGDSDQICTSYVHWPWGLDTSQSTIWLNCIAIKLPLWMMLVAFTLKARRQLNPHRGRPTLQSSFLSACVARTHFLVSGRSAQVWVFRACGVRPRGGCLPDSSKVFYHKNAITFGPIPYLFRSRETE